ncbi:MAG: c-type cytochrome [Litorivicinaceae bacterium]
MKKRLTVVLCGVFVVVSVVVTLHVSKPAIAQIPYTDSAQVQAGIVVYSQYCASCHGASLEGEPNWQRRDAAGLLPAPPHDPSGHTWHHPDAMLFDFVKYGPKHFAGADYATKMPGYSGVLSDAEIWAVLAYIKSTWPEEILVRHNSLKAN